MKKPILILLTILALTLAACNTAAATEPATFDQADPSARTLSGSSLLIVGTLKLDGTDQAVTAEQAKELLPLWQVYQSLLNSDTAAQEEVDALVEQIQDAMTDEQMKAIEEMKLTSQEMFAVLQEMGLSMGGPGQTRNSDSGNGGDNFVPGGGMPPDMGGGAGGGPGGVPGQDPGGQSLSPEQIATAQAERGAGGSPNRVPPNLVEALIQYLQKIVDG